MSFVIQLSRTYQKSSEEAPALHDTINRVIDKIDAAPKWAESLPSWEKRKRIKGPKEVVAKPDDLDDEIPF